MNKSILVAMFALLLIGGISQAHASVADDALVPAIKALTRSSVDQADILARKVVDAAGEPGARLVAKAADEGLDAATAAARLIREPRLVDLGVDGLRTAGFVGSKGTVQISRFGRQAIADASRIPQQARLWQRADDYWIKEGLPMAAREETAQKLVRDGLLHSVIQHAGTVGLGVALTAVGIGVGTAVTSSPEILSGPATAIGISTALIIAILGLLVALPVGWKLYCWARRSRTAKTMASVALLLGALATVEAQSVDSGSDFEALLRAIETADREAVDRGVEQLRGWTVEVSLMHLMGEANSLLGAGGQIADALGSKNLVSAEEFTEKITTIWKVEAARLVDACLDHSQPIHLSLPIDLDLGVDWPVLTPIDNRTAMESGTPIDASLDAGAWIRTGSELMVILIPGDPLVVDAAALIANEVLSTPVAIQRKALLDTHLALLADQLADAYRIQAMTHIEQWHADRRKALAAGVKAWIQTTADTRQITSSQPTNPRIHSTFK